MLLARKKATLLLCSMVAAAMAGSAIARPIHHKSVHRQALLSGPPKGVYAVHDPRYPFLAQTPAQHLARQKRRDRLARRRPSRHVSKRARVAAQSHAHAAAYTGFTSNALVADARRYIGTNPTGRAHLWCGAFMNLILKQTGHQGGGNLALGYLHYGHRVAGPRVGAIAVMRRRGGGHVGVVAGLDANGNPILISGNHNHTVAESVYPRSRIVGYVMPGS
jgi:uncharacterized protein (TIGR02594 family)